VGVQRSGTSGDGPPADARHAADRGRWPDAFAEYAAADAVSPLGAADLERWATAAYLVGEIDAAVDAETRAHHAYVDDEDAASAVRCGFWVAFLLLDGGDLAQAQGWLARHARLAGSLPDGSAQHGYVLIPQAFQLAAVEGRWTDAHALAVRALEVGRTSHDADLVALALNIAGRSRVAAGHVHDGMTLLDEAMVEVVSGRLSPIVTGSVYCSVIEACEETAEWRRAAEWTDALTRWCEEQAGMVTFTGQCLTHRAHVLRLRGELQAAARAAEQACERFVDAADEGLTGGAHYELGEVHRIRGELVVAEDAYRRAAEHGHDPQPGLALLRLAQGRAGAAASSLRRLDAESEGPVARLRMLPAFVEVMLAAGDVGAADRGAAELEELAASVGSAALRADAARARGAVQLATGQTGAALKSLRRAVEGWRSLEAPYEIGRTRVLIARACRELGDVEAATLEHEAAVRTLGELGASVATVYPTALPQPDHGLTPRELEVLRLVATGMTNSEIGDALHLAVKTVDRHVGNILGKLGVATRTAATAFAYEHGLLARGGG
jgi:DNA-binding CsgD family transcriptional regulator